MKNLNMDEVFEHDVILFTMNECDACKDFKPVFSKIIGSKFKHLILNVDEDMVAKHLAIQLGVRAFPTTATIVKGVINLHVGNYSEAKLKSIIKEDTGKEI